MFCCLKVVVFPLKFLTYLLNARKLDWPGNSPDLNPVENLWTVLKDKVAEKQPTSIDNLKSAIAEVWAKEITQEYCQNLVHSMP